MADPNKARLPLSERFRPERLVDLLGNGKARNDLRAWAERWRAASPASFRAAILIGPPGVGKTTAAIALAHEFGWALVEMNASDARNQVALEQVAGRASVSQSLDGDPGAPGPHRALILLDEADCLSGRATEAARPPPETLSLRDFLRQRYTSVEALNNAWKLTSTTRSRPFEDWPSVPRSPGSYAWARLAEARRDIEDWRGSGAASDLSDRGGLATIARLVRSTRQPLVLTVNDDRSLARYSPVFRSGVARIRFFPLRDLEVSSRLAVIARSEGIRLAPGVLEAIVGRSRGDFRAALNDLEAIAPLPPGPAQREALGARDLASDLAHFTEEALSSPRYYRSVEVRDRVDVPPDDLLPWIEENLDHFSVDAGHRDAGFAVLAAAELLLARARRWRVYGLWSYASELLAGGVPLAVRDRPGPSWGEARFPRFLAEMGRSRGVRGVRAGLSLKVGKRLHLSKAKATALVLPLLERLFDGVVRDRREARGWELARALVEELGLSSEEVTFLLGGSSDVELVEGLLAEEPAVEGPSPAGNGPEERETAGPSPEPNPALRKRKVQRSLSEFGSRN